MNWDTSQTYSRTFNLGKCAQCNLPVHGDYPDGSVATEHYEPCEDGTETVLGYTHPWCELHPLARMALSVREYVISVYTSLEEWGATLRDVEADLWNQQQKHLDYACNELLF